MAQDFRSANWYRVASVKPRLAPHIEVQRQVQRGVVWYVLFDPINQRTHRLTPPAWHVVSRMDGDRSVETLWREAGLALGEQAPPQDELIELLAQLHEADALVSDAMPDLDELLARRDRRRHERWKSNLLNPLSIRLRLWDPDAFLARTLPAVRWVFGPWGLVLWLVLAVPALVLAGMHWEALSHNFSDRLLSASSVVTLVMVYPVVKALHEMAHAYAAKAGGAAVHDMGLMFLMFAPVPYVDASGSAAFADKRRRALVAAAGMLMELALAAIALYVWLLVEPGLVRSVAYTVMVVGGVSTVLFNGNPLLRYDGYFVFSDWIESPNLAQRANQFWQWLAKRWLLGLRQAQAPQGTRGEYRWFLLYAPAALAYRVSITVGIALFMGKAYLYIGLAVGLWGLLTLLGWPMVKGLRYVLSSPELASRRAPATAITLGGALALLMALWWVPVPMSSYAQGTVWPAEDAQLRALEPGFVDDIAVHSGEPVHAGRVAVRLRNDQLAVERDAADARDERQHRAYIAMLSGLADPQQATDTAHSRVATEVQRQEWQRAEDDLLHAQGKVDRLALGVRRDGRLELPRQEDLPGRWFKKGELLGHVVTGDAPTVRVLVTQDDIELVRARLRHIEVRLAGDLGRVWPARLVREVPAGEEAIPSAALSIEGGGLIPVDGRDPERPRALNRVFQFDVVLPMAAREAHIGERAHVRFEHLAEPLGQQWARRLRQLVLSQLTL